MLQDRAPASHIEVFYIRKLCYNGIHMDEIMDTEMNLDTEVVDVVGTKVSRVPVKNTRKSLTSKGRTLQSYTSSRELVDHEAGRMFLALETKTQVEVAYEFGLDRFYSKTSSLRTAVMRAVNLVLDNPLKYDIPPTKAALIQGIMRTRAATSKFGGLTNADPQTLREQEEAKPVETISEIMTQNRDKAARLLRKRLEYLERHPKELMKEKIKDLTWVTGTLFDKGQIIQGNATEHIAVMSKVDPTMSSDDMMKAILNLREQIVENNSKGK